MVYGKKESLYLIYKVLEEYTDEEHYLSQKDIINKIYDKYGLLLERKSIASNIETLIELDFDIVQVKGKGYALYERLLEDEEIKYIVDAIFSSKSLSGREALSISKKLGRIQSKYKRRQYDYIYKGQSVNRTDKNNMLSIEIISEAIEENKKISFQYIEYSEDGKPRVRHDGYRFVVSPYYLINNNGRYYLFSNYKTKYSTVQNYRIDYMIDVRKEAEDRVPLSSLEGMQNFDIAKYINEHVYLFSSEVITAKVRILKRYGIQYIYDFFGTDIKIHKDNESLYCYIKASSDALFYWIVQFSSVLKVEEPKEFVLRIKEFFIEQANKYNN